MSGHDAIVLFLMFGWPGWGMAIVIAVWVIRDILATTRRNHLINQPSQ